MLVDGGFVKSIMENTLNVKGEIALIRWKTPAMPGMITPIDSLLSMFSFHFVDGFTDNGAKRFLNNKSLPIVWERA